MRLISSGNTVQSHSSEVIFRHSLFSVFCFDLVFNNGFIILKKTHLCQVVILLSSLRLCYNYFMKKKSDKRLIYPDLAKGIGIILVVLGHIEYISLPLRNFIVSFHMPLFFVISGILLNVTGDENKEYKAVVSKKAKSILLPYLYFSILDTLVYLIYFYATGRDGGFSTAVSYLTNTVTFYGISVLWFLPALFASEIIFINIRKKCSFIQILFICIIFVALSIFLNNNLILLNMLYGNRISFAVFHLLAVAVLRLPACMSFLAAGYFTYPLINRFLLKRPLRSLIIGCLLLIASYITSQMNGVTDLHYLVFNSMPLYIVSSSCGVFGVIDLCVAVENLPSNFFNSLMTFFGRNSLIVMLTHLDFYILYFAEVGGLHFSKPLLGTPSHDVLLSFLSLIFVLLAETFIIIFVNRFCPFLLGKNKSI